MPPQALQVCTIPGLESPFIVVSGTIGEDVAVAMMKAGAAPTYLIKETWHAWRRPWSAKSGMR